MLSYRCSMTPDQECRCPHHSVCKPCKATINTHIDRLHELKEKTTHFSGKPNRVLNNLALLQLFTNTLTQWHWINRPIRSNDGVLSLILTENAVALLFFLTNHTNAQASLSSNIADCNINNSTKSCSISHIHTNIYRSGAQWLVAISCHINTKCSAPACWRVDYTFRLPSPPMRPTLSLSTCSSMCREGGAKYREIILSPQGII